MNFPFKLIIAACVAFAVESIFPESYGIIKTVACAENGGFSTSGEGPSGEDTSDFKVNVGDAIGSGDGNSCPVQGCEKCKREGYKKNPKCIENYEKPTDLVKMNCTWDLDLASKGDCRNCWAPEQESFACTVTSTEASDKGDCPLYGDTMCWQQ